ncbi:Methyltransferase-like protein 7A like protein [Argiope bruennichi]|uniref:Methyltransferase-like protein 7A like protein n=1 Tax=Argiope bruennichi TaxID=94029 RepID=A0A8T0EJ28_ARGBR|nr:Methyltransferase-like protein 7A like protein [Argiope bruennichi]
MDTIIYTAVTIIWWTLSVSFLLPLVIVLKFSKKCRDMWFSWFFVRIVEVILGSALLKIRKCTFDFLKDHLPERKKNTNFEILEIGFGGGSNLQFYPENTNLSILDMNESFLKYFEESRQKNPHINYKKVVIGMAEDMHELDDESFDIVVSTFVLCSVKNVRAALKEVKRVLKPGGKYLFLEHLVYPKGTWNALIQRLANPVWTIYFDGCNINRNQDEEIRRAGFSDVVTKMHYSKDMWLYVRPMIIGIATK